MPTHTPLRALASIAAVGLLSCGLAAIAAPASAAIVATPITQSADDAAFSLKPIGTFETDVFDKSSAEIVASYKKRLFIVNAQQGAVTVVDSTDVAKLTKLYELKGTGVANSVAVRADGLGVIALEAPVKTDPGTLLFFDANADNPTILGSVTVGALPDMVAISKDGTRAVVANEGEPSADFTIDPEGSVGVVALPQTLTAPTQNDVRIADFHAFEGGNLPAGVNVFGPKPHGDSFPVSRNLEPEYVTIDGSVAYVSLQEANAIATVDLATATVTKVMPLGYKDHSLAKNALDPSDRDGKSELRTYENLFGMYQPDSIASYQASGSTYLVTANEGDAREWGNYSEGVRVKNLKDGGYGPTCDNFSTVTGDADLGRLNVTRELGFNAEKGCYDKLYAFGGRSFSIWNTEGTQVFDSGSDFERIVAKASPKFANSNHTKAAFDDRSDDKGPEPEGVAIGQIGSRTYAFIGLERVGGIMAYDITDPANAKFVTYINNRDFSVDASKNLAGAGDLGAEGVTFIPAEKSPTGKPVLAVANEVSGTTTLFAIDNGLTEVQILTINDFHGRIESNFDNGEAGAAVLAGAVDTMKAQNPNTLFISAGDNIGASTFTSFIDQDTPTIDALKAAGLDLSAVGNHEFDRGWADLSGRVLPRFGGADYGLAANVYNKGTKTPALKPYTVKTVDGVRVAFIATVTAETPAMVSPDGVANLDFGPELEAANRTAGDIKAANAADVIVLLTHNGHETSSCDTVATDNTLYGQLIRGASADINAIVSGHTHQTYACEIPGPDGAKRPVIQAHQYGTSLGKLNLSVDTKTKKLVSATGAVVPLVDKKKPLFTANDKVAQIVTAATAEAEKKGAVPVGKITANIVRGGTPSGADRGVESSMGNLVADITLWAASNKDYAGVPAQIGFMNPGGVRDDLIFKNDGTVTYRDVAKVQPFANTITTITLTGAQIKSVLEEQWQPAGSSRPKLHLGVSQGFTYTYVADAPRGQHITSMTLNGTPIDQAKTYVVAANSFLAAGGDNFTTFAKGSGKTDTGQVDLAASIAYFAAHSSVAPASLNRAVIVNGSTTPWAEITFASSTVKQGESLEVSVKGLVPGQLINATLHSDPIVAQNIPAADGSGQTAFSIAIPANFEPGAHTLVVESDGKAPISVAVTIAEASSDAGGAVPTPSALVTTGKQSGTLAATGAEAPYVLALGAGILLAGGLTLLALRRRSRMSA